MFTWIWQAENSWLFPNEWNMRPYVSTFKQFWTRGIILSILCWNCTLNTQRIWAIQEIHLPLTAALKHFSLSKKNKKQKTKRAHYFYHRPVPSLQGALVSWQGLCFSSSCILNRKRRLSRLFPSNSVWEQNVSEALSGERQQHGYLLSSQKHELNRFIKEGPLVLAVRLTVRFDSPSAFLEHPQVKLG